jgi:thiol-disulfide isomerase/thioredoxin
MEDGPADVLPPEDRAPVPGARRVPRGLLVALALAVVVLTIAGWRSLSAGDSPVTEGFDATGRPVPDLRYRTFEGATAGLPDLRGSLVVVNFWGSWCPPCLAEMPAFEQVHRSYGERVRFVGLAVNDTDVGARAQARRTGVSYPLGFDDDARIAKAFGLVNMPATILVDRAGTVVHVTQSKGLTAPDLTALVDEHLQPGAP